MGPLNMPVRADELETFLAEYLFSTQEVEVEEAVYATAYAFPNSSVTHLMFAITSCAAALEYPIVKPEVDYSCRSIRLYKCNSALAADLYCMHEFGLVNPTCQQLSSFWSVIGESYFTMPRKE